MILNHVAVCRPTRDLLLYTNKDNYFDLLSWITHFVKTYGSHEYGVHVKTYEQDKCKL